MPTKLELMAEAYKRGILPPDKLALFEEAKSRGLLPEGEEALVDLPGEPPPGYENRVPEEPAAEAAPGGPSFLERAGTTAANIAKGYPVMEAGAQMLTGAIAQPVSGLAGLGALAAGQGMEAAGKAISGTQEALTYAPKTQGGQQLAAAASYPFEQYAKGVRAVADPIAELGYPDAAATVATAGDLAPYVIGGRQAMKTPAKRAAKAAKQAEKTIVNAVNTAIKPAFKKKRTASQVAKYDADSVTAMKEIIKNKDNLSFLDESGTAHSRLPQSVNELQQAVASTKEAVFKEYDSLAKQTQEAGATIKLDSAISALKEVSNSAALKDLAPEIRDYAYKRIEALTSRNTPVDSVTVRHPTGAVNDFIIKDKSGIDTSPPAYTSSIVAEGSPGGYTAVQAQEAIKLLNQSLEAFYRDPSPATYGRSAVDSVIANHLRKGLDKAIETSTGKAYSAIKDKYAALKTVEEDISRAANRERNKATGALLPDFTDIFAGHQVVSGIASMNAPAIAGGIAMKTISAIGKMMKNPDRKIKNMFKDVEQNMNSF